MRKIIQLICMLGVVIFASPLLPIDKFYKFTYSSEISPIFIDSIYLIDTGDIGYQRWPGVLGKQQRIHIQRSGLCNYSYVASQNGLKIDDDTSETILYTEFKRSGDTIKMFHVADLNFNHSMFTSASGMHHMYGDSAAKKTILNSSKDTSWNEGLWKSPTWGGPQYEFKETWVRGLGLVSMEYLPNYMDMSGVYHFKTAGLPANPCNPNYENYHLSLVTHGTDTLYDASKVVVANLPKAPKGIQSQGGVVQIPHAWLNPKADIQVEWLNAKGQTKALPWTWQNQALEVVLNKPNSSGWVRVSQDKNWRVYRIHWAE